MKIDGKQIAQGVLDGLSRRVEVLRADGITPQVAVILIGDDASSKAYVRQKEIKTQEIGAAITTKRFENNFTQEELLTLIEELNHDETIHGIIVQRPLPPHIDREKVTTTTSPEKDIDSFREDSPFDSPLALAVWKILKEVYGMTSAKNIYSSSQEWLKNQKVVVLGKGETAGHPIIKYLDKQDIPLNVIDSKTENREELVREADIIISAVGRAEVITPEIIHQGAILIGVGMFRGSDGRLQGDYNDETIAEKAGFYTPIPGGVGPVNVAMLLFNLLKAAESL